MGAAAASALSSIPTFLQTELAQAGSLEGEAGVRLREKLLDDSIASIRMAANSPDVKAALEGKGDFLLSRVFRVLQFPVDREKIRGTKYDMSMMRRFCQQFIYEKVAGGKNTTRLIPASRPDVFRKEGSGAGRSNGFFWNVANRFMTGLHAIESSRNQALSDTKRDLALKSTGTFNAPEDQIVYDDPTLTNADIHGAYVCIEGIDPDSSSEQGGFKSYPGVALRIGRGFAERVWNVPGATDAYKDRMAHSFMVALPAGEAEPGAVDGTLANGMTGSAVWMNHNGKRVCAGILHGVFSMKDPETGRTMNVGVFHGVEEMRAEQDLYMRSGA